jgi:pyrimidine operon attenuation protein/uracil phosphoribosyltransferase
MQCFETLIARMEGAVAIDAWLLGLGDEGALLAERLAERLPGQNNRAALDMNALAQGALRTVPETALSEIPSKATSIQSQLLFTLSPRGRGCPEGAGEGEGPKEATIVLVDAVLWRGETIVQAVSLLRQHGLHAPIELAVLADRGAYLVPIAPTYCGGEIIVAEDIVLRLVADKEVLRFEA